jgi:hypothetical protein
MIPYCFLGYNRGNLIGVYNLLTTQRVFRTWWPLAGSWLLMSLELPALSAVVARLPNPAVNLAAYGGVVFPLALIIESPIIMFLAASTALSKDWASFARLRRYMHTIGAAPTVPHPGCHPAVRFHVRRKRPAEMSASLAAGS